MFVIETTFSAGKPFQATAPIRFGNAGVLAFWSRDEAGKFQGWFGETGGKNSTVAYSAAEHGDKVDFSDCYFGLDGSLRRN
jgi:hypothetical protein